MTAPPASPAVAATPAVTADPAGVATAGPLGPGTSAPTARRDSWPHTTRVLPWMLAAFIAMLWLVPFNTISLTVSLPFDLHLDRIVLPFIVLVWVLAIAAGGETAPRIRITRIHAGVGTFVGVAFLSVVLNAGFINDMLEFDSSIKHLVLLSSYALLFVMLASVVRVHEVRAFISFTLGLAVALSLGMLWEHRYGTNVFYLWSAKLLPGIFSVPPANSGGVDELGRRLTLGSAELGLEAAAMLSMALPIALVRILNAQVTKQRVWYGLAACVIVAASISTYRKTAMITPIVVLLTLAYFRRRELLRLAPLGLVLLVVVHALSPGALGSVVQQFTGSRLSAAGTVNHRAIAYEAVRPIVWTNPAFGQGYGSYDAFVNRILDSQMLGGAIETGIVGTAAYLFMILAVVVAAAPLIRRRDSDRAPPALIAACVAMAFLTVSFLYDATSFPHAPYIFLTFAAFLAVLLRESDEHGRTLEQEPST